MIYNKNSGIYKLLEDYGSIYLKNYTWILALVISLSVGICLVLNGGIYSDIVIKNLDLGLRIFPPLFALSLTSVSFMLSAYDKPVLERLRKKKSLQHPAKSADSNQDKPISIYRNSVMSFFFFFFIIAITICIYWISSLIIQLDWIKKMIDGNRFVFLFLIVIYQFFSMLTVLTALDIVSSLYSFARGLMHLVDESDKKKDIKK